MAFALHLSESPNVQIIRYEDLLSQPNMVRMRVQKAYSGWSDSANRPSDMSSRCAPQEIRPRNSSFRSDTKLTKRRAFRLEPELENFCEALAWHELRAMHYLLVNPKRPFLPLPEKFHDPYESIRPDLEEYRWTRARYDEEVARMECLDRPTGVSCPAAFPFVGTSSRLRSGVWSDPEP